MKTLLAFILLLPTLALADTGPSHLLKTNGATPALNAVALNASAANRTFTVQVSDKSGHGAFATIEFFFFFDYTANAGVISLTCTGGPTESDKSYTLTVCDPASATGECAAANAGILKSGTANLSADTRWEQRMSVRGVKWLSCVAAHNNSPGATDKITVKYTIITQ